MLIIFSIVFILFIFACLIYYFRYNILSFILLSNNGSYFTSTNSESVSFENTKKHHFKGNLTFKDNKEKYNQIITKLKNLNIFTYKMNDNSLKTIVNKKDKNTPFKLDDVISVTTRFAIDNLFTTSYEKISILEEQPNLFIICISSLSENIINGYYRCTVRFNETTQEITIEYAKVQSIEPFILNTFLNNTDKYINANKNSVMNTINYLAYNITDDNEEKNKYFTIDKVIYTYE